MKTTFSQLDLVHDTLREHYNDLKKDPNNPLWSHEDVTDRLQMFISTPYPPKSFGISDRDITGVAVWLTSEVERIAENRTGDFYSGMYKALLVLVFNMLREGRPPWR